MYKTVRHGENSLQYTILPQNDDFRIEGKLSSSGSNRSSDGSRQSKVKRPKRRSFFAYLGLIFVCTVIVGAVLIPFLVSAECLPSPREWFLKTKAAFIRSGLSRTAGSTNRTSIQNVGFNMSQTIDNVDTVSKNYSANIGKSIQIINQNNVETFVLKFNKTKSPDTDAGEKSPGHGDQLKSISEQADRIPQQAKVPFSMDQTENFVTEIRFEPGSMSNGAFSDVPVAIVVTTVRTPLNLNNNMDSESFDLAANARPTLPYYPSGMNSPRAPSNSNQIQNNISSAPTIFTRIMQSPLLKSTAKKPIVPPTLTKANNDDYRGTNPGSNDEMNPTIDVSKNLRLNPKKMDNDIVKDSDWMQSHWPYIDPTTYLQWTGYKPEDSVLLPALLGIALIGVILIVTICLIARNKRTIVSSVRKRNRNDLEATGSDDNATLLTSASLSDED